MPKAPKRKRVDEVEETDQQLVPDNDLDPIEAKIRKLGSHRGAAPLSCMEEAKNERDNVDYTLKITKEMAENGEVPRRIRVYADGIYDLFHQGHARQMMQAKNIFPKSEVYLMVGVCNDELTHTMKGKTVMSDSERYEAIRHCRYVDEVIVDAPWVLSPEFLEEHKIDFVAHDEAPYNIGSADDVYAFVKEKGMFVATERTEGVSTSDIVGRIIRDYDTYVRRNLARGYTRKDLNLSFVKGQRYKLQNKVDEIKTGVHEKIHKWEEQSKELISSFLSMFGGSTFEEIMNSSIVRAISPQPSPPASPSPPPTCSNTDEL